VGQIATFQITKSYIHDAVVGHEIKSRAVNNIITNNRIVDGDSTASYSIDLPNGGAATIQNNLIQQGPNSQNGIIISYSAETSTPYPGSQLLVSDNTIVNEKSGFAYGVWNFSSSVTAQLASNDFFGLITGQIAGGGPNVQMGNEFLSTAPAIDTSHP